VELQDYGKEECFRVRYDERIAEAAQTRPEFPFDLILSSGGISGFSSPSISPTHVNHPNPLPRVEELSAVPLRSVIPAAPLSTDNLAALTTRISDCNSRHKHNQAIRSNSVPDRLVDVRPPGASTDLALVEDTSGITGPYLALSHCWRGPIPYRTLKSNKDELCRRIDFSRLSRNFQDAVAVTRWLNFRYIWIDSFCIIQDDVKDWLNQSSKMASIYSGAYLTTSATRSTSHHEGFLAKRHTDIQLLLSDRLPAGLALYVRDHRTLYSTHISMLQPTIEPSNTSPLFRRAWAFQERLLSPRVLHFMEPELVLECEDSILCECGERDLSAEMTDKRLYRRETRATWEFLVELYTARSLTYSTDILPAISAVARDYGISHYLAGFAGETLMSNLV
jgi:hypothetical protein